MAWAIFKKIRRRDERDPMWERVRSGYIIGDGAALPPPPKNLQTKIFLSLSLMSTTDVDTQTHATFSRIRSHRAVQCG